MNSIYIKSDKILARKDIVDWLDGCGAAIKHLKNVIENTYIIFGVSKANGVKYWEYNTFLAEAQSAESMQCTTALGFCQGVARIMGIPEPTFGQVGISKTETTTKGIPEPTFGGLGDVTFDAKKYIPTDDLTISKTETVEPIKGMAIEVSRLSKEDKGKLSKWDSVWDLIFPIAEKENYAVCYWPDKVPGHASTDFYKLEGLTITESPTEFLKYVSQQTGKEYKRAYSTEELMNLPESEIEKLRRIGKASYPHKTYRILDSLDGVPLDTRFKLSEKTPTPRKKVLLIFEDKFFEGWVQYVDEFGFRIGSDSKDYFSVLDGEWMRIV